MRLVEISEVVRKLQLGKLDESHISSSGCVLLSSLFPGRLSITAAPY